MSIQISTSAFSPGGSIPKSYTCDGDNRSPDLSWSGLPAGTQSLALIVEDPDAPSGNFIHWVLYNLPPKATGLIAGQPRTPSLVGGGTQGTNDFRRSGYDGPCPPPGKPHRYFFRLYALDQDLKLSPGQTASQLRKAMAGHSLGQGELMGKYGR
jgi:Raf kinase inhibitor-like YbhB/YbcL family protein